ncbi:MAG: hypothetical protein WBE68_16685 [Candidatus Nitrosopolaris sp.]
MSSRPLSKAMLLQNIVEVVILRIRHDIVGFHNNRRIRRRLQAKTVKYLDSLIVLRWDEEESRHPLPWDEEESQHQY